MPQPRVSVVIIFLNEERFLTEAVDSVRAQTFTDWELFLVDDGSSDRSTAIAKAYAADSGGKIRYLEHPSHANRGMSASRNLGIDAATGEFVGVLDGDDVWLPNKLAEQVAILDAHPEIDFVGGTARWWYSWTGAPEDLARDCPQRYSLPLDVVLPPARLIRTLLTDDWNSPCDLLVRRNVIGEIGRYEPRFRGMYEDQVFQAKLSMASAGILSSRCWYLYRQHPDACTSRSHASGQTEEARYRFLEWFDDYLSRRSSVDPDLRRIVRRLMWPHRHPWLAWLRNRMKYRIKQIGRVFVAEVSLLGKK